MSERAPLMDEALVRDTLYHIADLCKPAVRQRTGMPICFRTPQDDGMVAMRPPSYLYSNREGGSPFWFLDRWKYLAFGARVGALSLVHRAVIIPDGPDDCMRGVQMQRHPLKASGHYLEQPYGDPSNHSLAMQNAPLTADLQLLQQVSAADRIIGLDLPDLEPSLHHYLVEGPTG